MTVGELRQALELMPQDLDVVTSEHEYACWILLDFPEVVEGISPPDSDGMLKDPTHRTNSEADMANVRKYVCL